MRTTITLDPDTEALLARLVRERNMTFKEAVNYAIRSGLSGAAKGGDEFRTPSYPMGEPYVSLDKALRLAGDLEDQALLDRMALRK